MHKKSKRAKKTQFQKNHGRLQKVFRLNASAQRNHFELAENSREANSEKVGINLIFGGSRLCWVRGMVSTCAIAYFGSIRPGNGRLDHSTGTNFAENFTQ